MDGDQTQDPADRAGARRTPRPGDDDPRLTALLADLELRLRPVCRDMAPADFEALIRDIAVVKLRWAGTG